MNQALDRKVELGLCVLFFRFFQYLSHNFIKNTFLGQVTRYVRANYSSVVCMTCVVCIEKHSRYNKRNPRMSFTDNP